MIRNTLFLLCASTLLFLSTAEAQFSFGRLFSKSDRRIDADAYATQQGDANAKLEKAMSYENAGRARRARDSYKSIVKSYPRTDAAAEAQADHDDGQAGQQHAAQSDQESRGRRQ